jgi:cytoskeletal protein CcmA (bactofilin family)
MAAASIIGQGTIVRGNVRGVGSIDIRGRVEGDVEVDGDVALGEGAAVSGNVSGAQISVAGQVQGDLRGSESVMLERGARVVGDLVAPRIGIAEGALVRGGIRTEGDASAAVRRAAAVPVRRTPERRPALRVAEKSGPSPAPNPPPDRPVEKSEASSPMAAAASQKNNAPRAEHKGPPAPVVPSLGKGARGKKRSKRA